MSRITSENVSRFEDFVRATMEESHAVGLAVAVIDKKGETQYEKFFGYRDEEKKLPVTADTIFGIASVTKSFTALSIMQLAEKGIIDVQAPVSKYVPEFRDGANGVVTVAHLLSHAGGWFPLPRILVDDVAAKIGLDEERDGDLAFNEKLAEEGIKLVAERLNSQTKFNGRPGQRMSYCNDGFGILSDIIRRYGGEKSFGEYVRKNILEPLDMNRSGIDFVKPKLDENSATLYSTRQGVRRADKDYHNNAFVLMGGGAMKSTLNDLKKYVAMYLNEGRGLTGNTLASPYTIQEMCRPRQVYRAQSWYGYGLSTKILDDLVTVEHGGSLPGVSSYIMWSYDGEAGVVVLCNTSDVSSTSIADAAMRMYNGIDPIDPRDTFRPTPWSAETVEAACGTYTSGEGSVVELYRKEDGTAGMKLNGTEKNFVPVNERLALIRGKLTDGCLRLYRDGDGPVWGIGYGGRIIPRG